MSSATQGLPDRQPAPILSKARNSAPSTCVTPPMESTVPQQLPGPEPPEYTVCGSPLPVLQVYWDEDLFYNI